MAYYIMCNGSDGESNRWLNGITETGKVELSDKLYNAGMKRMIGTLWELIAVEGNKNTFQIKCCGEVGDPAKQYLYYDADNDNVELRTENEIVPSHSQWTLESSASYDGIEEYPIKCLETKFGNKYINGHTANGVVDIVSDSSKYSGSKWILLNAEPNIFEMDI